MSKKTAIVYDWIDKWGGVERVLLQLNEIFPGSVFFTSHTDYEKAPWAKYLRVKTSFMQDLPPFILDSRVLSAPFYPYAFEAFDFKDFDLVISVSSSFAKSIITRPETKHILYHLTPTRFLWISPEKYLKNPFVRSYAKGLKEWDFVAAQRPDSIISISQEVAKRTKKFYKRNSAVLYPPFDTQYWESLRNKTHSDFTPPKEKFYLIVSRLEPYKNVELAIRVFNKSAEHLVVVGKGTQAKHLARIAKKNITFVQNITDLRLVQYYKHAEALIMPQEEDFGYVALEAQFFGLPVIALKKGGACETVIENKSGIFFEKATESHLTGAVERFRRISYNLKKSTSGLSNDYFERFGKKKFETDLAAHISSVR